MMPKLIPAIRAVCSWSRLMESLDKGTIAVIVGVSVKMYGGDHSHFIADFANVTELSARSEASGELSFKF